MAQQIDLAGHNNIVIQIEGDHNQVNLAYLTLTRYLNRREIQSEADLLSPYTFSIPPIGREQEMTELRAWLESPKPIAIRVLTGRAGSGKTRLALELCEQLLDEGWHAGMVTARELNRFCAQQNLSKWGWQRPTLIVIDYAAAHAEALYGWLAELSDHYGFADRPLRLLLLERNADPNAGWWQTAFGRGDATDKAIRRLLDPAEPVPVPALVARERRREIFAATLAKADTDLDAPAAGEAPYFDEQLERLSWGGEPLFLMMAGLLAAKHGVRQVLALSRTDLAFDLAGRELARIQRFDDGNPSKRAMLVHMAGYVTLCRGLDHESLLGAIELEQGQLQRHDAGGVASLADTLCAALPGQPGEAAPILPDMIGEAAILQALTEGQIDAGKAVLRAFEQDRRQVAATVIRTAQDFAGQEKDGTEILAPLEWLDTLIERNLVDVDQLMMIADALPQTSMALRQHAAGITETIVRMLRDQITHGENHRLPTLAGALNNLGVRLSELGRREEALGPAEEAVTIRREMAAKAPDAFRPDLAMSLNNLAKFLSELGRREEALGPAEGAVAIRRELAAKAPDAFRPDLAMSLNNLAKFLSELGRREEALGPAEGAVRTLSPHFLSYPAAFGQWMTTMLRNYLERCQDLEREPDAELLGPILEQLVRIGAIELGDEQSEATGEGQ